MYRLFVKGEKVPGATFELIVKGHLGPLDTSYAIVKKNSYGEEKRVSGYFYTNRRPAYDGNAVRVKIETLCIDVPVICWDPYQSHSVICI